MDIDSWSVIIFFLAKALKPKVQVEDKPQAPGIYRA